MSHLIQRFPNELLLLLLVLRSHVKKERDDILQAFGAFSKVTPLMRDSDHWHHFHRPTENTELMNRKHNNDTAPKPINKNRMLFIL